MSQFLFYLPLPPFLAQWFIARHGGETPVRLVRESLEFRRLRCLIDRAPLDYVPTPPPESQVPVCIPSFTAKDPRMFNYVPPKGVVAMVETIRDLFDIELHDYFVKTYSRRTRLDLLIEAWMAQKGIEYSDTNFNSVKKRLDRIRNAIRNCEYRRRKKFKK